MEGNARLGRVSRKRQGNRWGAKARQMTGTLKDCWYTLKWPGQTALSGLDLTLAVSNLHLKYSGYLLFFSCKRTVVLVPEAKGKMCIACPKLSKNTCRHWSQTKAAQRDGSGCMGPPLGFFSHASETLGIHGSLGSPIRSRQAKTEMSQKRGLEFHVGRGEECNAKQRRNSG